jgi:ABC-type multidrug transport system fused ATPase/permease subunit
MSIYFDKDIFRSASSLLSRRDRIKLFAVVGIQISLSLLDLAGVAIIGAIGALAVTGVQSRSPGSKVNSLLEFLNLENSTLQFQVAVLGLFAASFLVIRTISSVFLSRKILFFLARRSALLSSKLASQLLRQPLGFIQLRSSQETLYALTTGVSTVILGILGTVAALIADISLTVVMFAGLTLFDPLVALSTLFLFASIGALMYKLLNKRARALGEENSVLNVESNESILEVLRTYRENYVRNRRDYYAESIGKKRLEIADNLAEMSFLPSISKYVIESSLVIGALGIAGIQFALQDATHAIASLALFMAAGSRIAPAVLRIQQGSIQIRTSMGNSLPTLKLISELSRTQPNRELLGISGTHKFEPRISLSGVNFKFVDGDENVISNLSLEINPGESVAFVGPSGAGKSTLVDLILGIRTPDTGKITISGINPEGAIQLWPENFAYVPQDVEIINGTVLENIILGFPKEHFSETSIWEVLETCELKDFVSNLPNGLETRVGEFGSRLSGGQRQRLGLARALITNPKIIFLDEATSSLDGETESLITDSISTLKGRVTVVLIAHRLSTVRNCDKVVYLEAGQILARGSFQAVRDSIPNFDAQARLMGL